MKIKLCKEDKQQFLDISKDRRVFLEGNIIKLIDGGDDEIFKQYLLDAKTQDINNRKKRLEVTKQVQIQNRELIASQEENESLMIELKEAVIKAEIPSRSWPTMNCFLKLSSQKLQTNYCSLAIRP